MSPAETVIVLSPRSSPSAGLPDMEKVTLYVWPATVSTVWLTEPGP